MAMPSRSIAFLKPRRSLSFLTAFIAAMGEVPRTMFLVIFWHSA